MTKDNVNCQSTKLNLLRDRIMPVAEENAIKPRVLLITADIHNYAPGNAKKKVEEKADALQRALYVKAPKFNPTSRCEMNN